MKTFFRPQMELSPMAGKQDRDYTRDCRGCRLLQSVFSARSLSAWQGGHRCRVSRRTDDFLRYVAAQAQEKEVRQQRSTARNYRTALRSLAVYAGGRPLPFSDVTAERMVDFGDWLRRRGVGENTTSCYMRSLRACYNRAVDQRLVAQSYPFRNVYTGVARTRKRSVGIAVVRALAGLDLEAGGAVALARDLFVFSFCARGMAFVDMAFLRKTDIRGDRLTYCRRKTGTKLEIRVEPCMAEIMARYGEQVAGSEYVFPILTSTDSATAFRQYRSFLSYYNVLLKRLARMIHWEGGFSSYASRHTWASEARNKGVPLSVISAGMGHSSERTTQIYLASLDNSLVDEANRMLIADVCLPPESVAL